MAFDPANIDHKALALRLGASIDYGDGRVFNASGRKAPPARPAPAPAPVVQPPVDNGHEKLAAALQEMMSRLHVQQAAPQPAPVVNVAPAQVVVNPQPRCSWDFDFIRNADGSIKTIKATPRQE